MPFSHGWVHGSLYAGGRHGARACSGGGRKAREARRAARRGRGGGRGGRGGRRRSWRRVAAQRVAAVVAGSSFRGQVQRWCQKVASEVVMRRLPSVLPLSKSDRAIIRDLMDDGPPSTALVAPANNNCQECAQATSRYGLSRQI